MTEPTTELLHLQETVKLANATMARVGTDEMPLPADINDHTRFILGRVQAELGRLTSMIAVNIAVIERRHASPQNEGLTKCPRP